ncbi:MAG TPA: NAD-dependent epimerase/dehydratase family protein [Pyrinomonadaceae bacterium]
MKILITGSRGFVGGSLGRFAVRAGHDVLGISRATQPSLDWPGQYVSADVVTADLAPVIREFAPDAIFHAAGTASVGASFKAPMDDLRASLLSWANLLDSAHRAGTPPLIIFPSSGAVYGQLESLPVNETARVNPISPYGFHKAACELLAQEYATCFNQRLVVCRLFSLFGEHQRRLLVWELFRQFAGDEDTVWLQGTGEETRDYLHVADMAAAVIMLAEVQIEKTAEGGCEFINVASGSETRVIDLAHQMRSLIAPDKKIRCRGVHRTGDPERWQGDITRLRTLLPEWNPKPLIEGLETCIAAWRR